MPFDPSMDKVLKKWKCDETGLVVSINQYGDGESKLQIGPRVFKTKEGKESQRKAGRLTMEDVMWLNDKIEEITEELKKLAPPG